MKRLELSVLLGLVLAVVLLQFTAFAETCDAVRSDTLRLHILANSDTAADQSLKLAVRDALLQQFGALFATAKNEDEAAQLAQKYAAQLQQTALQTVAAAGYSYPVRVRVERIYFATKQYDNFTLPAGDYDAVRVEIGTAKGHNWFCVMYPAMCLPAAAEKGTLAEYKPREKKAVESPYKLKFAVLELAQKLTEKK